MARPEPVFGMHTVRWLLRGAPERVLSLMVAADRRDNRLDALLADAGSAGVAVERVASDRLDRLAGGGAHQGVAAMVRPARALNEADLEALLTNVERPLLVALDGVEDPRNLGAVLRTAEAAGVDAVIAPRERAAGLGPAARKVACGAAELVPFVQVTNLARTLKGLSAAGIRVVGLAGETAASLFGTDLAGPACLVLGGEARGLRRLTRERCDELVRLPMTGGVESLNVSVAAGVAIYEAVRQRS